MSHGLPHRYYCIGKPTVLIKTAHNLKKLQSISFNGIPVVLFQLKLTAGTDFVIEGSAKPGTAFIGNEMLHLF